MIFTFLILLFIGLPILELALLLKVGQWLGVGATIGLVILTGVLGATLARYQGLQVLFRIRKDLSEGRMPAPYLLDGLMILLAGAVLLTPGLITDTLGFLFLMPSFRKLVKLWLRRKIEEKIRKNTIHVTYWE